MKLKNFGLIAIAISVKLSADSSAYLSSYYYNLKSVPPKGENRENKTPNSSKQTIYLDSGPDQKKSSSCSSCDTCSSKPCCNPCPPCDDSCYETGYSPYFNQLQCAWGGAASIEFLYWYAKESNLSYAMKVTEKPQTPDSPYLLFGADEANYLNSSWDPGFRLSLGFDDCCNEYDFFITWTWMKNNRKDQASVSPFPFQTVQQTGESFLITPWVNQSLQRGSFAIYNQISAFWELVYNQVDFEIGRRYCSGPYFTLRPFAAIRAAFWETKFNVRSSRKGIQVVGDAEGMDSFNNDAWGVGFVGGIEPAWYFCRAIALYGQFDVALLWGCDKAKKKESLLVIQNSQGEVDVDYENTFRSTYSHMTPQIDVGIGLRWESTWCNLRYRSTLDIGWEHHVLMDQNHRIKSIDNFNSNTIISGFHTYVESSSNIGLGGLIIKGKLDF